MNLSSLEQLESFVEFFVSLCSNPITLILIVCYGILQFLMPFFIIRLSIKCDKLENKLAMQDADINDKLNYLINQQKQQEQNEN